MPATPATESAIVVPVPAVEQLVGQHRERLDPAARWGVPAHVTVLYPFVPPGELDGAVLAKVRSLAARLTPISATFRNVRWFDQRVVYLAPEPDAWFRHATSAFVDAFPECPPYGGAFDDVVPHLTIGDCEDVAAMQAAAESVASRLPVAAMVDRVWLMSGTAEVDTWKLVEEFTL